MHVHVQDAVLQPRLHACRGMALGCPRVSPEAPIGTWGVWAQRPTLSMQHPRPQMHPAPKGNTVERTLLVMPAPQPHSMLGCDCMFLKLCTTPLRSGAVI